MRERLSSRLCKQGFQTGYKYQIFRQHIKGKGEGRGQRQKYEIIGGEFFHKFSHVVCVWA